MAKQETVETKTVTPEKVEVEQKKNTIAELDKVTDVTDKLTDDGKKHKQGEVIRRQAFGVVIETKF